MWTPDPSIIITAEMKAAQAQAGLRASIDAERDRRIAGGFIFAGKRYQTRPEDRENIAGASTAALAAIMAGVEVETCVGTVAAATSTG